MTKIPVVEEYELNFKTADVDQLIKDAALEMKNLDIKYRKRQHFWCMVALWIAMAYLAVGILNNLITMNKLTGLGESSEQQAQCESIGGRYDGEACWYNGEKIDVNTYVKEWK